MPSIAQKTILITGASSGIGEATARTLATAGARVVLGARRTERLQSLAAELRSAGGTVEYRTVDVTSLTDMQAFAGFALERFGGIDVLVNNAGVMPLSPLAALKLDEWNRMIDVNIRGVLHGIASVLPHMTARKSGQIINVASVAGFQVWPTSAVYSGTKYAVRAISEGLRQETKDIRVTIISPGAVESELAETITDAATRAVIDEFRKVALPAQAIADAIAYAIAQPSGVDVNELVVRPTATNR
jgi:NADP-dependent 3-hydroxy acid dehydrogenase YdfG